MARVQRWCAARVPEHARHQVRVACEVAPRHLTIVERRPPWRPDLGPDWTSLAIGWLRYTAATRTWTLYWRDRHLPFHLYDRLTPSPSVDDLLGEIDRDPTLHLLGLTGTSRRYDAGPIHATNGRCGRPGEPPLWSSRQD